jgi:hypothetical protein
MARTIGIDIRLPHLGAMQSFMKMGIHVDHGHTAELRDGTWVHHWIITVVICIMCQRHMRTTPWGPPNYFASIFSFWH